MNNLIIKFLFFFAILLCFSYSHAVAQSVPADLSNIRVEDLSDAQVSQLMQQASTSGLSDAQLIQAAKNRGLSPSEALKLQSRVSVLRTSGRANNYGDIDTLQSGRKLNYTPENDSINARSRNIFGIITPKIFGSDIFNGSNLTFAPNLNMATPLNYIIGPSDQLNVNIYGNSVANWKLQVSPEGNINIPGSGLLFVSGKSIEQATIDIKAKLSRSNYAVGRGTSVQVSLGSIRSIKVILVGEVKKPGNYTLPSLATAFTALYAAGGPSDNGSYRRIEIIRNNRIVKTLDVYDFLVKGDQKSNIGLQDQDIIRVPSYGVRVELRGQIKNPALFEVVSGESLADVLRFSGGFTNEAFVNTVKILQVADQQRRITDVKEIDYKNYVPLRGDVYIIDKILDRYENRVTINGAVFRPGVFELDKGLTISGLIKKAAGVKEDAFMNRAIITRLKPDNTRELISFNVKDIINKSQNDIMLQREDSVYISSIFELRDKLTVTIKGEVRKPGEFAYVDSMKVADLIIKAGGFAEGANTMRIEVAERIKNTDPNLKNAQAAIVFTINLNNNLDLNKADFTLHPYDIVSVYSLPGYEKQRIVKVEGEVLSPGYYAIKARDEKISDLIIRAGNLTALADANGSSLRRTNASILGVDKNNVDSNAVQQERAVRLRHLQSSLKDSSVVNQEQNRNNYIGINMNEIMKKPGSAGDIILEDGDVLRVPKQLQLVRINGEVLYPSAVVYTAGESFNNYVSNAGGYSPQALKKRAYIVYPNGTVEGTKKFLIFNRHPSVRPGSEIYVPKKPTSLATSLQTILGVTTALASLSAIIFGIVSLHK